MEVVAPRKSLTKRILIMIGCGVAVGICVIAYLQAKPVTVKDYRSCIAYGYPISGTSPQVCTAQGKTFPGPYITVAKPETVDVPFQDIGAFSDTGNYPEKTDIISTQIEWQAYWDKIHQSSSSKPLLPAVDFSRKVVVGISQGPYRSRAVGIQILSVKSSKDQTLVSVSEIKPGETCSAEAGYIDPAAMIAFDIPSTPIKFDIQSHSRQCS